MVGVLLYRRPVDIVYWHYALVPHLSVGDNIAHGPRRWKPQPTKTEICGQVLKMLDLVGLSRF